MSNSNNQSMSEYDISKCRLHDSKNELNDYYLTPADALECYSSKLTEHEKIEILNYDHIYYIGNAPEKFALNTFDHADGSYIPLLSDSVAYRFEILNKIAHGSFGSVLSVFDHKKKIKLALKIIKNKKEFQRQSRIEIGILKTLKLADKNDNFNFVQMINYFTFRNHTCITFELLSINLYKLLAKLKKEENGINGCDLYMTRCFTYQIVKSLLALKHLNIIHSDIKPENIVLKDNKCKSTIKLVDFGSSCFENERIYTYIQSRYYRAPEVICQAKYGTPIDMFSLGCLIVELLSGKVLFKSVNQLDHLAAQMELLGNLPEKLNKSEFYLNHFMKSEYYITEKQHNYWNQPKLRLLPGTKDPNYLFNQCKNSKEATDFVRKCINLDDSKRLKPIEALNHPFLSVRKEKINKILNLIEIMPRNYLNVKDKWSKIIKKN